MSADVEIEEWRPIPSLSGYDASTLGRVRSWRPRNGQGPLAKIPQFLKLEVTKEGYHRIGFWVPTESGGRKKRHRLVHQLVLETFVGPCPPGHEGCHDPDHTRSNNRLSNLRWDTRRANANDRMKHGTSATGDRNGSRLYPERLKRGDEHPNRINPEHMPRGEDHYAASIDSVKALAIYHAPGKYKDIAEQMNTTYDVVFNIKGGRSWCHVTGARRAAG